MQKVIINKTRASLVDIEDIGYIDRKIIAYRAKGENYVAVLTILSGLVEHTTRYGFTYLNRPFSKGSYFTGTTVKESIRAAVEADRQVYIFENMKEFAEALMNGVLKTD